VFGFGFVIWVVFGVVLDDFECVGCVGVGVY